MVNKCCQKKTKKSLKKKYGKGTEIFLKKKNKRNLSIREIII